MIRLDSISKRHGRQILFLDAAASINRGEKVGLVGPNGAGKTSLFRLIVGEEQPDGGQVTVDRGRDHRLLQSGRGRHARAQRRWKRRWPAPARCRKWRTSSTPSNRRWPIRPWPSSSTELVERFGEVQVRFDELGGYGLEARCARSWSASGSEPS